jgi:hypothetical protein
VVLLNTRIFQEGFVDFFELHRIAFIIYETASDMNKAFEKFSETQPEVNEKKLRIMKYDPTATMPPGKPSKFCTVLGCRLMFTCEDE